MKRPIDAIPENWGPVDSNNPDGYLISGGANATPMNDVTFKDLFFTIERIKTLNGITANGLYDTDAVPQLYNSIINMIKSYTPTPSQDAIAYDSPANPTKRLYAAVSDTTVTLTGFITSNGSNTTSPCRVSPDIAPVAGDSAFTGIVYLDSELCIIRIAANGQLYVAAVNPAVALANGTTVAVNITYRYA